jgi:hypothetical protein
VIADCDRYGHVAAFSEEKRHKLSMNAFDLLRSFALTVRRLLAGLAEGVVEFRKAAAETSREISRVIHGDDGDPPAAA